MQLRIVGINRWQFKSHSDCIIIINLSIFPQYVTCIISVMYQCGIIRYIFSMNLIGCQKTFVAFLFVYKLRLPWLMLICTQHCTEEDFIVLTFHFVLNLFSFVAYDDRFIWSDTMIWCTNSSSTKIVQSNIHFISRFFVST